MAEPMDVDEPVAIPAPAAPAKPVNAMAAMMAAAKDNKGKGKAVSAADDKEGLPW